MNGGAVMQYEGLIIGVLAFLIIGIFHPIVIKAEYHFSEKIWPLFLLTGGGMCVLSLFAAQRIISSALGIAGCTCLWSILELKEQTKRVDKGWFPRNPKRDTRQSSGK